MDYEGIAIVVGTLYVSMTLLLYFFPFSLIIFFILKKYRDQYQPIPESNEIYDSFSQNPKKKIYDNSWYFLY